MKKTLIALLLSSVLASANTFIHIGPFKSIKDAKSHQLKEYGHTFIEINRGSRTKYPGIYIMINGFKSESQAKAFINKFKIKYARISSNSNDNTYPELELNK